MNSIFLVIGLFAQTLYIVSCFKGNFKSELICAQNHMVIYVTSVDGDFNGIIYTEGSFENDQCRLQVDGSRKIMFEIPYDKCSTKQENGVYSNVVIVQKHARILTNEDAAFLIKCDERNLHEAKIIVTEAMFALSKKESEDTDYYKPHMKENNKKMKILYNDKETITYVGSGKNASSALYHSSKV